MPSGTDTDNIDRRALRQAMKSHQNPDPKRSIWQLINTIIPYVGLWVLTYYAVGYSVWLAAPLIVLLAGFQIRLFIIFHDCGHSSFFRSQRANDFWGVVTGVLTFTPYHFWRMQHARHHATSGNLDERGDGDIWMMTVDEYVRAPWMQRLRYRLYRNPFVMLLLGPLFLTLVSNRLTDGAENRRERRSIYWTNLGILAVVVSACWLIGWQEYMIIQFSSMLLAQAAGVWLFYVQHQFEGVYWARGGEWDFVTASLLGGSFYDLPRVLRWFTGSIGYHHIHHLNPKIPNYNLARCHEDSAVFRVSKRTGVLASLKALRYRLWDEDNARLISFGEYRRTMAKKRDSRPVTSS
ncbi:MAG: fatty acid desaturase [candidate division Zixibacteria bacterium]|nr:fatty acid desaturase [candidate division Zixibacteria bacterium]